MFGVVNPTEEQSGDAYASLVAQLDGGKSAAPKRFPFGGALIDNPNLADGGDDAGDDASATGGSTAKPTGTQSSGGADATDPALSAPGADTPPASGGSGESAESTETNPSGSGAGSILAPMAGLVGAVGFAVLLG